MDDRPFQVAVLYNEDNLVTVGEAQDLTAIHYTVTTAHCLYEALTSLGYATIQIVARESLDEIEDSLRSLSPKNTFIFNNCDGFAGSNRDAVKVIRLVERMGFKHTGAPADAIEACIDKPRCKEMLIQAGVPTPPYQVFKQPGGKLNLRLPVIVKPAVEDGSIGINFNSVVSEIENLMPRIGYVLDNYQQPAIVEEFILGRELTVALWGGKTLEILPIAEQSYSMISNPMQRLLTYEAKWDPNSPYYHNIPSVIPAPLTADEDRIVRKAAETAFRVMGLRDFGRMDIRFYNNTPYIIDINELPDLSPEAGFWKSAEATGISYPAMVERLLGYALEREGWQA